MRSIVFCLTGIVAGSFCPPEVIRKVINVMGIGEMLVSNDIKHEYLINTDRLIKLSIVFM